MNPKVTAGLVVLLAALAGYLYFFEGSRSNEKAQPDSSLTLYHIKYSEYDIIELQIEGAQGQAHFARTDQTLTQDWEMLRPTPLSPDEVDQVRVNGAANRLGSLTASRAITNVTDLAQYGLDSPELTVTLTISNGQKIILYTGDETPVNENRYLRTAEDNQTVYLVFGFAVEDLHRLIDEPPLAPLPASP
jgi:hypothetical protein